MMNAKDNHNDARHMVYYSSMAQMSRRWLADAEQQNFPDIVEIMGGEGRTAEMLLRRTHHQGRHAGRNFDLQCGVDLSNADDRP
eukprot:9069604-Pyramimonas_sp.AAC.1